MKSNIYSILFLTLGLTLAGCQDLIENPEPETVAAPKGEMAFCIGTEDIDGEPLTKGMVSGEENTSVASLQLVCFDKSGYFLGLRTAYPVEDALDPKRGIFTGYVPESTARIHFVANVNLDLSSFAIGTAEKVIMTSELLSTKYSDINQSDPSVPKICFWGYHKETTPEAMKTWLTYGLNNALDSGHTVALLRDRARIQLTVGNTLHNGSAWQDNSAGTGKRVTSIKWGINNGRERGYLAPFFSPYNAGASTPWEGYDSNPITMNEYKDCDRYTLLETELDEFAPSGKNYQYVFDDSNRKTSVENGRITIVLEVNYENNGGGGAGKKYLLAQLRIGSGADEGEMVQITRNATYVVNITDLSHDGYTTFADAANKNADDFTNAPADVDITVPYITDGTHFLNLLSPKPVVVTRVANTIYTVEFEYKRASSSEEPPVASDFKIYWEDNINSGWTSSADGLVGSDLAVVATATDVYKGTFTVKIGTIGTSYAFTDYLVIRHKKSGLSRNIHFYAVEKFIYRMTPVLEQVKNPDTSPYMGPSADDTGRPVFRLRFKLSQSVQEDLFPLTVKLTSSTLEPYGDKTTSATARLSGGFAVLNASTATASSGVPLPTLYPDGVTPIPAGSGVNDWNYKYTTWNYWYGYTLNEYPKTGENRDGEVIIYLKDIRDAYAQASSQDIGLYLDVENFEPVGLTSVVEYPSYTYAEGTSAKDKSGNDGEYTVGSPANRYRVTITGCVPNATYTLSEEVAADWLTENSTSITADASGNLVYVFSVTANTVGERSAIVIFTNSANTSLKTKLTITQEAGMAPDFRLKVDNTSVMGNTKEVNLTVYSSVNWTLGTSSTGASPGTLSVSGETPGTSISGTSTGDGGKRVKLIMPVNYETTDITYTVTLAKTADPLVTVSDDIVQRAATLHPGQTVTFTAGSQFTSGATDTRSGIIGTFPSKPATAGGTLLPPDPTVRWDYTSDFTLTLNKEDSVKDITGVAFVFHDALGTTYCPHNIDVTAASGPSYAGYYGSDYANWSWTADAPVTTTTFSFVKGSYNIGLVSFTVTYTGATWE